MKKTRWISLLLCLCMVLQSFGLTSSAFQEVPQTVYQEVPQTESQEETVPGQTKADPFAMPDLPFGEKSIKRGCRTLDGMQPLAGMDRMLATSQAVFAYEAKTDTVIYAYNPDTKMSPGTLAKIVTALIVIENCELDEIVTCSEGIQSKVPGSSQKVNLKSLEKLTVEDLLHCLLMQSANDAAVALAEHVAGTTKSFVELMNRKAKILGCTNTEFGNISGLDTAVSYSTARDMARIMAAAYENETFMKISGTLKYTVPETNLAKERTFNTTNYMLDNTIIPQFLDTRVKGGLASATDASGASMAAVAEYNDMELVCVVLGALRTYDEEESWKVKSYGNFDEMQELLDYLYRGFKVNQILFDGQSLSQFSVINGECDVVGMPYINYSTALPVSCNMDNLYMEYNVVGGSLQAPIREGEMIATVAVKYRNSYVAEAEIFAMNTVKESDKTGVTVRSIAQKGQSDMDGMLGFLGAVAILAVGGFGVYVAYNSYRRAQRRIQRRRRRASRRRSY
ncbi:MAG: D-alanyl-D-alanine carboxypeptidase [Oscillospiraceae bacterium]|nr:D-alanyl-D-alanine carboxypeptidase [Oscillospiraceae bacterium]